MTDIIWEKLSACIQCYMAELQTQHRWESKGLGMMKNLPGWLASSKLDTGLYNGGFSSETLCTGFGAEAWFTCPLNTGDWKFCFEGAYSPSFWGMGIGVEWGWIFWNYTGSRVHHFLYINLKVRVPLQEMERLRFNSFIKPQALMYDSTSSSCWSHGIV